MSFCRVKSVFSRKAIAALIFTASALPGCQTAADRRPEPESHPPVYNSLPFQSVPFSLLTDDFDGNGRIDIAVVSHSASYAQIFFQKNRRHFSPGQKVDAVGFHPGDLIKLPGKPPSYLMAAEGENALFLMKPTVDGDLKKAGALNETAARHAAVFQWPGWGVSLAVSPFQDDYLVLLKDFDSGQGAASERIKVPLSDKHPSIRRVDYVTVADVDGDRVDEILFASRTTNQLWMLKYPRKGGEIRPSLVHEFKQGAPMQVLALDVNGNGSLDLIVPDQSTPYQIHVLLNDGSGHFQESTPLPFPTEIGIRRVAARTDRDGSKYLLAAGYGAIVLYRFPEKWDGRAKVTAVTLPMVHKEGVQDIVLRDVDGDGWLDGIVGRGLGGKDMDGVWIIYGPLWEHFAELADEKFELK